MKKFKVLASYVTYCTLDIEAENEDIAWKIAKDLDGGAFETTIDGDDWQIDNVVEITE